MLMKTSSYYPYGGLMGSGSMGVQPYKYGGKELDRENGLDLYDSHARMYDPIIGRTTTIDPLAEKYTHLSPYLWCAANPLKYVDPSGMDWYQNNDTKYYTWFDEDNEKEGFKHIGGKGSLVGEFEPHINKILENVYSRPLKSPFLRDIVQVQYLANFLKYETKSFHGSFEVICHSGHQYIHSISYHTLIKVAAQTVI